MSSVVISGDTSGAITLQAPAVAGSTTLNLPASSGTIALNGPAFSAYRNGNQTGLSSGVYSKINLNAETFDTASCFDSTTNYRFTPNVAGYYQINATINGTGTNLSYLIASIYKNGSGIGNGSFSSATASEYSSSVGSLVYLNGSTDYIELYSYVSVTSGTGTINASSSWQTFMTGALVRAA